MAHLNKINQGIPQRCSQGEEPTEDAVSSDYSRAIATPWSTKGDLGVAPERIEKDTLKEVALIKRQAG
jgi:hypothetical protein